MRSTMICLREARVAPVCDLFQEVGYMPMPEQFRRRRPQIYKFEEQTNMHKAEKPRSCERGAGIRAGSNPPPELHRPAMPGEFCLEPQAHFIRIVDFAGGVLFYPQNSPKGSNLGISLEPQCFYRGSGKIPCGCMGQASRPASRRTQNIWAGAQTHLSAKR